MRGWLYQIDSFTIYSGGADKKSSSFGIRVIARNDLIMTMFDVGSRCSRGLTKV